MSAAMPQWRVVGIVGPHGKVTPASGPERLTAIDAAEAWAAADLATNAAFRCTIGSHCTAGRSWPTTVRVVSSDGAARVPLAQLARGVVRATGVIWEAR